MFLVDPGEDRALENCGSFAKADAVLAAIDCVLVVVPLKVSHGARASFFHTFVFQPFQWAVFAAWDFPIFLRPLA